MHITGTLINYFYHCKRQCWLFYNKLNLENNSENVRIGKVLHEIKNGEKKEIKIENISLDKITSEYVVELKKSDADVEAAKAQLLYYLRQLKRKGIIRKGRLEFFEKNKQSQKVIYIELDEKEEKAILALEKDIEVLLSLPVPPAVLSLPKCKKCAYYEYCYI